jgi:hypothetical protein
MIRTTPTSPLIYWCRGFWKKKILACFGDSQNDPGSLSPAEMIQRWMENALFSLLTALSQKHLVCLESMKLARFWKLEKEKNTPGGTWTRNLHLRRVAPYPLGHRSSCADVELELIWRICKIAPLNSNQRPENAMRSKTVHEWTSDEYLHDWYLMWCKFDGLSPLKRFNCTSWESFFTHSFGWFLWLGVLCFQVVDEAHPSNDTVPCSGVLVSRYCLRTQGSLGVFVGFGYT